MSAYATARAFAQLLALVASTSTLCQPAHAAVGRTPGTFKVSPTGAAQYVIPLWTPPGAGGMRPDLSIFYSHTRDNGLLGMGFDIGGFSAITRCAKMIMWDTTDGPIQMQPSDPLCLDGTRILLVSGTHGVAGSEYRTNVETFSKIKAYSGGGCSPIWFEVHQRNGLVYQYGNSTDSCIDFGSGGAREWALTSIRDRSGNTTTFKYIEDASNGSHRPDEITYATNGDAGLSTAPYRVKFFYEGASRPDPIRGFWPAGGLRDQLSRMQRVEIQHNTSPKRMYLFEYTTSATSGRSRLWKVKECSTVDTDCLQPTVFEWTTANAGLQAEQNPSQTVHGLQMIDVTGDGRDDMVYSNHATSGSGQWRIRVANSSGGFEAETVTSITNTNYAAALPITWDGDRFMDLLVAYTGGTWHVLRSNGSTFETPLNTAISSSGDFHTMDLNGDQKDDLVRADSSGGATVYVRYNLTGSFGSETALWSTNNTNFTFQDAFPVKFQRHRSAQRRADFDGDGREDWICWLSQYDPEWGTTYTATARCSVSGYAAIEWSDGTTDLGSSHMYGDLNDDGQSDIVWVTSSIFKVLYGGTSSITSGPSSAGLYTFSMSVGDYDGDGRDDVLAQSSSTPFSLQYLRSTGNGLAAKVTTAVSYPAASVFRLAEINGDDRMDVVSISGTGAKYRLHEPPYDLLASATDGFGVAVAFTYASMTDASVYTVGSGSIYPTRDVQYAMQLVKQLTATDASGTSGTYTLTFTYASGRAHAQGMGFLGFEKRTTVDSRNGLTLEETYLQQWPLTGLLKSAVLKQSSGNVIRQTTHDWWQVLTPSVTLYPYIWNSVTVDRELDNTHFRTIASTLPGIKGANGINGTWGLVTDFTTTTTEIATGDWPGHAKTEQVTNTLHIDAANWCVRPAATEMINDLSIGAIPSQTRTLERSWDTSCRIVQERIEPGNTSLEVDTDYEFDLFGNVKRETVTGAGMTARITEIEWGSTTGQFPETITNPLGHVTTLDYNYGLGVLTALTDPNSEALTPIVTSWTYDAFGHSETETQPDLTDVRWDYATCMTSDARVKYALDVKLRKTTDAVMRADNVCFDRFDRPIIAHLQLTDGGSSYMISVRKFELDALGRVSRRDNPFDFAGLANGYWTFSYDLVGRVTAETLYTAAGAFNRDRTHGYGGLTSTTQNFLNYTTTHVATAWGDLARVTDAASGPTTYEFDAFSQPTKVTDPFTAVVNELTYNVRGMKLTSADNDMGLWTYEYNALGELLRVRDAKTTAPSWTTEYLNFDALGRPGKRRDTEGDTDYTWGNSAANNNIGRLASVAGPLVSGTSYSESLAYDAKARLASRSITISGDATYAIDFAYHAETGFLDTLTYPVSTSSYRFKLQYEYAFGALTKVKRFDSPFTAYWTLDGTDPRGNAQLETLGNTVTVESTYDPLTGFLSNRVSNSGSLTNLAYQWDANGNLTQRQDVRRSLTETFTYDGLDRVLSSTLTGVGSNLAVSYDGIGNITAKDGSSFNYTTAQAGCSYYSHSQRHAVRKVGTTVYCYDKNGNMEKRGATTITWTSFNQPLSISSGTPSSQFWYGPNRERIKQIGNYSGGSETTHYVGGILEKLVAGGVTHFRHRIENPQGLIAIYDRPTSGSEETFYFTKDHLGSIDSVTDASGNVEVRLSYDAFGARRDESDWNGAPTAGDLTGIAATTRRAYTEHEQLDNLGLVHMNGRVQDPAIGRFVSADPYVPDPMSSQSFNRYSYVANNPLTLIDPSGFDYEFPHQNDDARTETFTDMGLFEARLWSGSSIGPDVVQPVPQEGGVGFGTASAAAPNPVAEEPAPESSSVEGGANPSDGKEAILDYQIVQTGGAPRRPAMSLEQINAHIRELEESLQQTQEMYARFAAEREAMRAEAAEDRERFVTVITYATMVTPAGFARGMLRRQAARSAAQAAKLSRQLASQEIAGGHAFVKHVVQRGEFPGIRTRGEFANMIEGVMENATHVRQLSGGRTAFWRDGVVVIRHPGAVDGGTAFVPTNGFSYFEGLR